jgi:hypothetical protein
MTLTVALGASGTRPASVATSKARQEMMIRIRVGDSVLRATLTDSKASRDFASLLPLTVTMNDLFRREKYAHLPRAISEEGERSHDFEVGDVAYWPPSSDVAIFFRQDGQTIPDPGIIHLGKIDSGVEVLDTPDSTKVTFELGK